MRLVWWSPTHRSWAVERRTGLSLAGVAAAPAGPAGVRCGLSSSRMIAFFGWLFGLTVASDLRKGRGLAETLAAQVIPEEYCRRLRVRLAQGDWHFTTGQILHRRVETEESDHDYAGHSGYVAKPIVVYGWRQHDQKVMVHRLDRSLQSGQIDPGSDDELIRLLDDRDAARFVVAYRRWSTAHGLFHLPGEDRYSRIVARESARAGSTAASTPSAPRAVGASQGHNPRAVIDPPRDAGRGNDPSGAARLDHILTYCDPRFREGYDVKDAVIVDADRRLEADRQFRADSVNDDLMRDSIAAMNNRWPTLNEELRSGAVTGLHGSPRRFGPEVRYYVWRSNPVEISRDEWLASAAVLINAAHDRARLSAFRNVGKHHSYAAFQSSADPERLATSLAAELTDRLCRADDASVECSRMIDDLNTLGHPFYLWDEGEGHGGWVGYYAYAPPPPGGRHRFSLWMEVSFDNDEAPVRRARVIVQIRAASEVPPGFPAD